MGNYCYGQNQIDNYISHKSKITDMEEQQFFNTSQFQKDSDFQYSKKLLIFGDNNGDNFMFRFDYPAKKFVPLYFSSNKQLFNYSGVVQKDEDTIIVCGGIKHNLTNIQRQCLEIQISTLNVKQLSDMIDFRYTFPIVYYNNCIYAIGGRQYGDDQVSILKKCEKFDYRTHQWTQIAEMNIQRCTHSAFVYNGDIWAIGGYTGRFLRSRKVEKYIIQENRWEIVDFKLQQGFENGVVTSTQNPNEILILGGKKNYGENQACNIYNLQTNTIINTRPLNYSNIIPKFNIYNNNYVVVLSEMTTPNQNRQNTDKIALEVYNTRNFQSYSQQLNDIPIQLKKLKQTNCNQPQLEIAYRQEQLQQFLDVDYTYINLVFGTDNDPFQLEIDQNTTQIKLLAIPVKLHLQNFQGVCKISNNEVLFAGGINSAFRKISQNSFIYNLQTREIQRLDPMNYFRYTFPLIKFKNYVYAVGGREFGDNQQAIMNRVERYNLVTGKWEHTEPLNIARCTSNTFVYRSQLFVAGGFTKDAQTDTIEIFQEQTKQWFLLGMNLYLPLEASVFIVKDDDVYCFGGRSSKGGDTTNICKVQIKDKDFGSTLKIGKFSYKMCLHKMIHVRDSFIIFGNKNSQTFKQVKNFKYDQLEFTRNANSSIKHTNQYQYFCKQLMSSIKQVCFDKDGIKRCSYIDSFTNINQFKQKIYSIIKILKFMFLNLNHLIFCLYFIIEQLMILIFFIIILPNI